MSVALSAFGKVPKIRDFVFLRVGGRSWEPFEMWLTQAVAWHESSRAPFWVKACQERKPIAFIYRSAKVASATDVIVGVIWPSSDAVTRRFPLVVFTAIPEREVGWQAHLLPCALEGFFDGLAARSGGLGELATAGQVDAHFQGIPSPLALSPALAGAYDQWTQATGWPEFWAALYGSGSPEAMYPVLQTVLECVRPLAGQERPQTLLGLRLPVGTRPALIASFWVDLVRGLAGWKTTIPTCFWPIHEPHAMVLQLGEAPASSLTEAWVGDRNNDNTCDLASATPMPSFGPLPPSLTAMLRARLVSEAIALSRS